LTLKSLHKDFCDRHPYFNDNSAQNLLTALFKVDEDTPTSENGYYVDMELDADQRRLMNRLDTLGPYGPWCNRPAPPTRAKAARMEREREQLAASGYKPEWCEIRPPPDPTHKRGSETKVVSLWERHWEGVIPLGKLPPKPRRKSAGRPGRIWYTLGNFRFLMGKAKDPGELPGYNKVPETDSSFTEFLKGHSRVPTSQAFLRHYGFTFPATYRYVQRRVRRLVEFNLLDMKTLRGRGRNGYEHYYAYRGIGSDEIWPSGFDPQTKAMRSNKDWVRDRIEAVLRDGIDLRDGGAIYTLGKTDFSDAEWSEIDKCARKLRELLAENKSIWRNREKEYREFDQGKGNTITSTPAVIVFADSDETRLALPRRDYQKAFLRMFRGGSRTGDSETSPTSTVGIEEMKAEMLKPPHKKGDGKEAKARAPT